MAGLRALLCLLFLALPLAAQEGGPILTDAPIALEVGDNDAAIAERLRAVLTELGGYENVQIGVNAGIVTLEGRALDRDTVARLDQVAPRIEGVVAVDNRVVETTDVAERLNPAWERFRTRALQFLAWIPLLAVAALAGSVVWWIGTRVALRPVWDRIAPNAFIAELYRQVIRLSFILLGLVLALDILGARALLGTILGAAGIFGLAVGFAVRESVENFIASVLLSLRSPFHPMDLIEINGQQGRVIRLTSRATFLISPDGNHFRIPNATVFKASIINYSRHPERRFSFTVTLPDHGNPEGAQAVMLAALQAAPFVLESPGPAVWIEEWPGDTVQFGCVGWVLVESADFAVSRGEAIRVVKAALETAGFRPHPEITGTAPEPRSNVTDPEQDRAVTGIAAAERADDREDLLARTTRDE